MTKVLRVALDLPVRAMTEAEWAEAWDGCGHDEGETEGPNRTDTLEECEPSDFIEAISSALNSADNPEVFAGTGLFVHIEGAQVTSIDWAPATDTMVEPLDTHNALATDFVMMAGRKTGNQSELLVVVESAMLASMLLLVKLYGAKPANASALIEATLQNATERFSIEAKHG